MRNLAVLAAFLLLVVGAFSAGTTCSNSHCTASSPCASVEPYSIANVSCHHIDRVFQIYTKLPGYRVDGTAQLKDVNMLIGSGLETWPRTIKNVICNAVESYPTPFSSSKTNCQAYNMGTETYLGIKTRDITIHDMYEVVAFAMQLGELIRDYNTGHGNTALGPLQALCGEDGLGDTFGSLSPKWRTQNFTNPNSQSSTVSGSYNPFPYHPGYTLYDDQAKLSNFFVRLEEALTDNNAYLIMTYMAPEDLSECLPINTTRYDLDN